MSTISSTSAISGATSGGSTAASTTGITTTPTLLADATVLRQASTRLADVQFQLSRTSTDLATSVEAQGEEPTEENAEAVKQAVSAAQQALVDAADALDLPPPGSEALVEAAALPPGAGVAARARAPQPTVPTEVAMTTLSIPGALAGRPGVPGLGMGLAAGTGPLPYAQTLLDQAWAALAGLAAALAPRSTEPPPGPTIAAAPPHLPAPEAGGAMVLAARLAALEQEAVAAAAEAVREAAQPPVAAVALAMQPGAPQPLASPFVHNPMSGAGLGTLRLGADPAGLPSTAMGYAMAAMAAMSALGTRAAEPGHKGRDKAEGGKSRDGDEGAQAGGKAAAARARAGGGGQGRGEGGDTQA